MSPNQPRIHSPITVNNFVVLLCVAISDIEMQIMYVFLFSVIALVPFVTCLFDGNGIPDKEIIRSYRDVFPLSLLPLILKDAALATKLATEQSLFGKYSTNWLPMTGTAAIKTPRFATEQAIHILKDIDFPGDSFNLLNIAGAEWWYQLRGVQENIGFHYDKDESIASNQMRMVYPILSTVFYATNSGAPTIILNMTTPNGNGNIPIIANEGFVSFPVENKHIVFNGNYMHGVHPDLHKLNTRGVKNDKRVTLLVNWWIRQPLPPNCVPLQPADVAKYTKETGSFERKSRITLNSMPENLISTELNIYTDPLIDIVLPPDVHFFYMFPKKLEISDTHLLTWNQSQSFSPMALFNYKKNIGSQAKIPLSIFFHNNDLKKAEQIFNPIVRNFGEQVFKPYVSSISQAGEMLSYFGLTRNQLPAAAICNSIKPFNCYLLTSTPDEGKITRRTLYNFHAAFLDGTLMIFTPNTHSEL